MDRDEILSKEFQTCKKNPGHVNFYTLEDCSNFLDSLPSCYRNDPLVEKLVRCQAKRTVQITIRCGDEIEVGTGFVHTVTMKGSNVLCHCDACEESPKMCKGEIDIRTAYHVIKDNPPKNITCTLNYDSKGSAVVTTFVDRLKHANSGNDTICLVSVTCQESVLEYFKKCVEEYSALYKSMRRKYLTKRSTDITVVLASHPHGTFKLLTACKFRYMDVRNITDPPNALNKETKFYDASTCPGSSGADVLQIGGIHQSDAPLVHCGALKSRHNENFGNLYKEDKTLQANHNFIGYYLNLFYSIFFNYGM